MVDIDRFYELLNEVCEELPDDFFRELHYGVHLSEECRYSPYADDGSMVILGDYTRSSHGNKINIYYGSFAEMFGLVKNYFSGDEYIPYHEQEKMLKEGR